MKTLRNLNAPCPPAARFAARLGDLARRGLCSAPLAVALVLTASTVASARTETLRWMHDNPSEVVGFVIYYGPSLGNYTSVIDVPALQPDVAGVFTFDISVPDDATIYVAVTAYGDLDLESGYSNVGTRGPDSGEPDTVLGTPGKPYVVTDP